ncbi:MAG TPA: hypothetical protein VFC93_19835 [Chloroflexota bacterium]|nr:hypothetical protein [Chloroflexota bacterium]
MISCRAVRFRLDGLRGRIVAMLGTLGVPDDAPSVLPATRDNVIACRVGDREPAAIHALVAAGARGARSEAAAWLIRTGIEAKADLLARVEETAAQIERLRRELNEAVREAAGEEALT